MSSHDFLFQFDMSTPEHSWGLIQCTQRQLSILEQSMTIWVKMSFRVSLGKKKKRNRTSGSCSVSQTFRGLTGLEGRQLIQTKPTV